MSSNDTTYCIYRIVCTVNGKVYVGQTKKPERRKHDHFYRLKQNKHINKHLQNAFNCHGEQFFYFEILESGIDEDQIAIREQFWIVHFNSCINGFNATVGGDFEPSRRGKRTGNIVKWNGVEYPSVSEAARANNIGNSAMRKRLKHGYKQDSDVPKRKDFGNPCTWNGVPYPTVIAAANANNVTYKAMWERIREGISSDEEIRNVPCIWNGVLYSSISKAAKALGISYAPMYKRVTKGYQCDEDMIRPRKHKVSP